MTLPAWRTDELPPLPPEVERHAVGYGTALRHDLACPARKIIYEHGGDGCTCREAERRCARSAQMAYAAGVAAERERVVADLRTQGAHREDRDSAWRNGWECAHEAAAQRFERGEHLAE